MGLDTIPERTNGSPMDQTWFNLLRSVLNGDFVPRDSDGVVTDQAGSLGSATYRWLYAYMMGCFIFNGNRSIKLEAPSSMSADYVWTLPPSLPASGSKILFIDSNGDSTFDIEPDNSTLEVSGSTLRVKDGGITRAKLAALGEQVSSSSGTYSTTSASFTAITNLSRTITTTGRPVYVGLISDGTANDSLVGSASGNFFIRFKRDSTGIGRQTGIAGTNVPSSSFYQIDEPAAGTYVYSAEALVSGGGTMNVSYAKLIVFEM